MSHLDKIIYEKRATHFQECFYFGTYRDDCLVLWCGYIEKLNCFYKMLNTLDEKLKSTMEIEVNSISFLHFYSKLLFRNNCL